MSKQDQISSHNRSKPCSNDPDGVVMNLMSHLNKPTCYSILKPHGALLYYGWDAGFVGLIVCAVIGRLLFQAAWPAKAHGYKSKSSIS